MESGKSSATPIKPGFRCAASGLQHLRHPDKLIERSPDGMQWNPGNIARVRQTPDSAKPVLSPSKGCIRATLLRCCYPCQHPILERNIVVEIIEAALRC